MALPPAEIEVLHGAHAVQLRPSLRAAVQIERLHDGFPRLLERLQALDLATIQAVIRTAATDRQQADTFLAETARLPLNEVFEITAGPCLALVAALIPEAQEQPQDAPRGKPLTWADYHARLFSIATGWLQWSPNTAWSATPAEIEAAFAGHVDMLRAIHGSTDEAEAEGPDLLSDAEIEALAASGRPDPTFDRAGLAELRSLLRT